MDLRLSWRNGVSFWFARTILGDLDSDEVATLQLHEVARLCELDDAVSCFVTVDNRI